MNDLNDVYRSAYRRGHSTETALLRVHSDIAEALDEGSMTALIMLDLSEAFDGIDHPILQKRLECFFGIKKNTSPGVGLLFCVPQGFVLRPTNYCMHTKPIGEITKRYNIKYHL